MTNHFLPLMNILTAILLVICLFWSKFVEFLVFPLAKMCILPNIFIIGKSCIAQIFARHCISGKYLLDVSGWVKFLS